MRISDWSSDVCSSDLIVLLDEACEILCRAVCEWAGVPLAELEVTKRARDFAAMIDAGAAIGLRHWRGRWARNRAEKWIGGIVEDVRNHRRSEERRVGQECVFSFRSLCSPFLYILIFFFFFFFFL